MTKEATLVERLRAGEATIPGREVVWVQNMRAFLQTEMFRTFPEWRKIFEDEFNALLLAASEAATALEAKDQLLTAAVEDYNRVLGEVRALRQIIQTYSEAHEAAVRQGVQMRDRMEEAERG